MAPEQSARRLLERTQLLTYSDRRVLVEAVADQVIRTAGELLEALPIVFAGDHAQGRSLGRQLADRGAKVTLLAGPGDDAGSQPGLEPSRFDAAAPEAARALAEAQQVIVWPKSAPWFGVEQASRLDAKAHVLDARIGGLTADGIEHARRRGIRLLRVNMWPALAGHLYAAQESVRTQDKAMGWGTLAGVNIVAGGAMGSRGDVVVDSVKEPTRVIGVADGRGSVLFADPTADGGAVKRVADEINRRMLAPRARA